MQAVFVTWFLYVCQLNVVLFTFEEGGAAGGAKRSETPDGCSGMPSGFGFTGMPCATPITDVPPLLRLGESR